MLVNNCERKNETFVLSDSVGDKFDIAVAFINNFDSQVALYCHIDLLVKLVLASLCVLGNGSHEIKAYCVTTFILDSFLR